MKKLLKSLLIVLALTMAPVTVVLISSDESHQATIEVKDNDSSGTMAVPGGNGGSGGGG